MSTALENCTFRVSVLEEDINPKEIHVKRTLKTNRLFFYHKTFYHKSLKEISNKYMHHLGFTSNILLYLLITYLSINLSLYLSINLSYIFDKFQLLTAIPIPQTPQYAYH